MSTELQESILAALRKVHPEAQSDSKLAEALGQSVEDIATATDELHADGLIQESTVAPRRWIIVLKK
jgi:hypothetical protein